MQLAHRCPKCAGFNTVHVQPLSHGEAVYDLFLFRRYGCMSCNWPFREFALRLHVVKEPRLARANEGRDRAN